MAEKPLFLALRSDGLPVRRQRAASHTAAKFWLVCDLAGRLRRGWL